MVHFHLSPTGDTQSVRFAVPQGPVLLAGSRRGRIPAATAQRIVAGINSAGLAVLVGCAPGIDEHFRRTCATVPEVTEHTFVACAFESRVATISKTGVYASLVVPQGVHPKAALRRRTLWMVKRAVLLILFPDDPATGRWGRGSGLAFRAAVEQLKPVFVVTRKPPVQSLSYHLIPARLWDAVDGYTPRSGAGIRHLYDSLFHVDDDEFFQRDSPSTR